LWEERAVSKVILLIIFAEPVSSISCPHPCLSHCHPGPCPPCNVLISPSCHCGSTTLSMRCSNSSSAILSCHKPCDKQLSCGVHRCVEVCHANECQECEVTRDKRCFCGKEMKTERCVEGETGKNMKQCFAYGSVDGQEDGWDGEFSCQRICDWKFDCMIHSCGLPCHSHSDPKPLECPFSPNKISTCPCSHQTPLSALTSSVRTSCSDPIPTCRNKCLKTLECGHSCKRLCHEGDCLKEGNGCAEIVKEVCRCGELKLERMCWEATADQAKRRSVFNDSKDPEDPRLTREQISSIRCEKVCKALKSCGKHECGRKCCPLFYKSSNQRSKGKGKKVWNASNSIEDEDDPLGLHQCERACGKKLSCGLHVCERTDHKGGCPPCLRARFQELSCHCG
jgi:transcriptional repressor NF-X1